MNLFARIRAKLLGDDTESQGIGNLYAVLKEAHSFFAVEKYDEARELLLKTLKSRDQVHDPATIDWILRCLGPTWLYQGKFPEQIEFFSKYIKSYPADSAAYHERATALWYSGQLQGAIEDFSRALELNPADVESLAGRGQVLAELGKFEEAMDDLKAVLKDLKTIPKPDAGWGELYKDNEAFVLRGRGVVLAGRNQIREAMNDFESSIALSPNNAWVYYSRAQVYDRVGYLDRARSDYRMALIKSNPPLTRSQKEDAQARVSALSGGTHS